MLGLSASTVEDLEIEFSSKSRFDNQVMISKLGGNQNLKRLVFKQFAYSDECFKTLANCVQHNDFSLEEIVIDGVSYEELYGFSSPLD